MGQDVFLVFQVVRGDAPLVESGRHAMFAIDCFVENNRWADFLEWRVYRAA